MAFTMTCGCFRMPIAKMAPSGISSRSSSMPRSACMALSAGMSTRITSGLAARTRRTTGSPVAMGKLVQLWTVRATLVPSTSTCNSARCSLSVATMTTESSAIRIRGSTAESISTSTSFQTAPMHAPAFACYLLLLSNLSLFRNGCGFFGPATGSELGLMRCTVHKTISSELFFCRLRLRKKFPRIGISPNPGILL